jgi:P pilus assembly chaperone PapD
MVCRDTFARLRRCATALLGGVGLVLAAPAGAQGDLLIAPTRIVLNGGGSGEVILSNIGDGVATYRIGLELRRMRPDGHLEDVTEADATALEKMTMEMIRYAPRRITLEPNQPQSIRISARPPAELPDGEYRVHLSFRAIPAARPVDQEAPPAEGLTIQLTPIYGLTIPLFVRKGQLEASAAISNPQVVSDGTAKYFRLDMARTGNRSIYGEIRVVPRGAKEATFTVRGIAIYPELQQRTLSVQLAPEQAAKLSGPVRVEYREMPENGGKLIAAVDATLG